MAARKDIDAALNNITQYALRDEWGELRETVYGAHLDPVAERIGDDREGVFAALEQASLAESLGAVMFEDVLTHPWGDAGESLIANYLRRRGWRELPGGRRYLDALARSLFSLYEVVEVEPGRYCDVRDLVRGGEPVRVHERSATATLVRWDRIGARVLALGVENNFSGGVLPYTAEAADRVLDILEKTRRTVQGKLRKAGRTDVPEEAVTELLLRTDCYTFTVVWTLDVLKRLSAPAPELRNSDGDALLLARTRLPLRGDPDAVAARLNQDPDWEREDADGAPVWLNLAPQRGEDAPRTIKATLELRAEALILSTNSASRTEAARDALQALLGELVGAPLTEFESPERAMDAEDESRDAPADDLDPEQSAQIIQSYLDAHYRRCLDERIPALSNKTPRQCVRSKKGRALVIDWLKHLENSELRRARHQNDMPYDFAWMWEALGLRKDSP